MLNGSNDFLHSLVISRSTAFYTFRLCPAHCVNCSILVNIKIPSKGFLSSTAKRSSPILLPIRCQVLPSLISLTELQAFKLEKSKAQTVKFCQFSITEFLYSFLGGGWGKWAELLLFKHFFMIPKRRKGKGKNMHNSEILVPKIVLEDYKVNNKCWLIT